MFRLEGSILVFTHARHGLCRLSWCSRVIRQQKVCLVVAIEQDAFFNELVWIYDHVIIAGSLMMTWWGRELKYLICDASVQGDPMSDLKGSVEDNKTGLSYILIMYRCHSISPIEAFLVCLAFCLPLVDQALELANEWVARVTLATSKSNLLDVSFFNLVIRCIHAVLALSHVAYIFCLWDSTSCCGISVISNEKLRLISRAWCDATQLIPRDTIEHVLGLVE